MLVLKWHPDFNVGVKPVDNEHKQLRLIMGRVLQAMDGGAKEDLAKNLDLLAKAAAKHFSHEERLLCLTDFPAARPHEREHAKFLSKVHEMKTGSLTVEAVCSLCDRYEQHIKHSDKEFSGYLNVRGIR